MSLTKGRPQHAAVAGGQSDETESDREIAYQVLGNQRRRFTVHYLIQHGGPVSLRPLSEQVAAWENNVPRQAVTPQQRKRVYTALHQAHLPKLDRYGLITYDTRQTVVKPTDDLKRLTVYMDVVSSDDVPWSVFYTGTAALLGGSALLGWGGLLPFGLVSGYLWAILISAVIMLTGVVNMYRDRHNRLGVEGPPPEVSHH
ncbi:hypothetical protein G6M89_17320 [Natronolimnobius sp. AArcel1]|uniref:DUF7344 domain-containing protein n=1 Tax=Natronolimnobius sp. AArcel1 TaxID=1679093 RepID=UPI0013EAE264|nr:hypothetical protein [Natronolimnobius sp. AArcel1]NGM70745.1 hypothetical protein [Natronolimnobius sp. AArcel1]